MKLTCYSYRHENLMRGIAAYAQKIDCLIGHAEQFEIIISPRPLAMLKWSAKLVAELGEEIKTVTDPRKGAELLGKIQHVLKAGRTLLDDLDRAIDKKLNSKKSLKFSVRMPRR